MCLPSFLGVRKKTEHLQMMGSYKASCYHQPNVPFTIYHCSLCSSIGFKGDQLSDYAAFSKAEVDICMECIEERCEELRQLHKNQEERRQQRRRARPASESSDDGSNAVEGSARQGIMRRRVETEEGGVETEEDGIDSDEDDEEERVLVQQWIQRRGIPERCEAEEEQTPIERPLGSAEVNLTVKVVPVRYSSKRPVALSVAVNGEPFTPYAPTADSRSGVESTPVYTPLSQQMATSPWPHYSPASPSYPPLGDLVLPAAFLDSSAGTSGGSC